MTIKDHPKVLIAILARDKEACLPLYLECIKNLDYPKDRICLYIRTNNNEDRTENILKEFVQVNALDYANIEFDNSEESEELDSHRHHDWNHIRFKVLGKIRNDSLKKTIEYGCDFYFVADCDNFILPHTLNNLLSYKLPIVSPMLANDQGSLYSNFHYDVDENGYFKDNPAYTDLFSRTIKGIVDVKVVHCTYLVRSDVIDKLTYDDESGRYEYVIFSDSARKNNIPQYLDNTEKYGMITFKTDVKDIEKIKESFCEFMSGGEASMDAETTFSKIYSKNIWGGSGMGSTIEYTESYRIKLMEFIREFGCKSVVDIGCGDWQFSSAVDWSGIDYLGIDVVQSLIDNHNEKYKKENINFSKVDVIKERNCLPFSDFFILKDVIQHWPTEVINKILPELQKKCKYILITNCSHQASEDQDISLGDFRPLSHMMQPLSKFEPVLYHKFNTKEMIYVKGDVLNITA